MFIVVGLGNPGREYEQTRHNIGFLAINALAEAHGVKIDHLKFNALTATTVIGTEKVLLMKPQTYMNNSGEAVGEAARFYKVPPENILVISDDVTLEPGTLRIRRKGSAGGHNGLKSIINHLSSDGFPRIKIGVGDRVHPNEDLADHVLGKFAREDIDLMNETIKKAVAAADLIVKGETAEAMNLYNTKKKKNKENEDTPV
ncbi:MAG: aminoacyl-tRNA hydrolase [Oscillospiraceae bacterium]|nr:aminoacyl-tRNA hydrolase [Candidatus Limimonas coprohippi]